MGRTYLDYNATAPLRPEARAAMVAALDATGNASSVHREGRAARKLIEQARAEVAGLVGGDARHVTFTSGGTEANNTVLTPAWSLRGKPHPIDALLVGATEHVSVLDGGRFSADQVERIPVDSGGVVVLADLEKSLARLAATGAQVMVSVMLANNETGAIQPVAEIARLAHAAGALVHTDAVQAAGRIPIDIAALGVDVLTLSAHKIGGPQGAGAVVRAGDALSFAPLSIGGGQEKRLRAGTENVAAIAGFGAAARAARADIGKAAEWAAWRDRIAGLVSGDRKVGGKAVVFSADAARLPQTLCFAVPGLPAETLLIALDLAGAAVSSGSACSSGKVSASHVLAAMGVPTSLAKCAIRVSLGWDSRESDLDLFASAWRSVLDHIAPGEIQAA
ncbi:MAG: cysteine desulfurase family protein [Bauldia sp.]